MTQTSQTYQNKTKEKNPHDISRETDAIDKNIRILKTARALLPQLFKSYSKYLLTSYTLSSETDILRNRSPCRNAPS